MDNKEFKKFNRDITELVDKQMKNMAENEPWRIMDVSSSYYNRFIDLDCVFCGGEFSYQTSNEPLAYLGAKCPICNNVNTIKNIKVNIN